ncbi:hypothetical protein PBI_DEWDROP_25 [Microbacterium phage Dewdrop]|nr:hypothetical protein PBI_LEAF_25 [Microbacterium phage Leaf]QGZ17394.1 hypothetical protein PBI_DEWDROP_25 [Microbacterium phage Dewdrop]
MSAMIEAEFRTPEGKKKVYRARLFGGMWWSWRGIWPDAAAFVAWAEKKAGWEPDPEDDPIATARVHYADGSQMDFGLEVEKPAGELMDDIVKAFEARTKEKTDD